MLVNDTRFVRRERTDRERAKAIVVMEERNYSNKAKEGISECDSDEVGSSMRDSQTGSSDPRPVVTCFGGG